MSVHVAHSVPLGFPRYFIPSSFSPSLSAILQLLRSDLEVLCLRVPVPKRDARRAQAMFLEIRRLVPFALLRRIHGRDVIPPGGQAADAEVPGLIGPGRRDVT